MNISSINFTARKKILVNGQILRRHQFKAPHDNVPYPTKKNLTLGPKPQDYKTKEYAQLYIDEMHEILSKNPNNSVARMLLKEYTKILNK